jgi:hypothetical protein
VSEPAPGATVEYSRASPASWLLIALAAAGGILLAAAEFSHVVHITVAGNEVDSQAGGERHSYALLLLGALALLMAYGAAANASRPAMTALAVLGLIAVAIALIGDAPHLDDVGVYGQRYDEAAASAQTGFYLETLGGVLLVVSGVLLLSLTSHARPPDRVRSDSARATPR